MITAPILGATPLPASVSVLVTADTSLAASDEVGNSMIVVLPPIPLVTTVIVRVILVEAVNDVDPVDDVMYGNMLLALGEAWPLSEDEVDE